MQRQSLKIFLVLVLVITLLAVDFVILGQGIAIAIYEDLETQSTASNIENVQFDAYFLNDGVKTHSKQNNLDSEETLIINVNVKEKGLLKDAKIKIENANFELVKDKIQNSHIKNINLDANEIELNEIIYQDEATIEIPIKFKKQESFAEDYFERENMVSLIGTYKDGREQEFLGQIKTRMIWTQQVDVNLSDTIEKYINLEENGILLQENVTTQVVDNKMPRENEILNLQVPIIDEQSPQKVMVLLNGEKLPEEKITYNEENKSLEIRNETKGIWGKANNEYKIIYKYSADIEFTAKTINLQTQMQTKLYTQEVIKKSNEQTTEINQIGNVVSASKTATDSVYKGYMYANSYNETNFNEYNYIEISDISSINNIELSKEQEAFINEQEEVFDITEKTLYKATEINKADFIRIFGSEGEITINDKYGNVLNVINQNSEADESGNIRISYEGEVDYIKIITSKPISEGIIPITNVRAIKGETGYSKEQLQTFSKLSTKTKVVTNKSQEILQAEISLKDTQTEAKIEVSNNNLSTLQNNENVQFIVTLKSNNAKYDLYKNPNLEIVFPQELKLNIKNIRQLNKQDELSIVNSNCNINESGEQVISIQLQGEQKTFENDINEGIQISIVADIEIDKTVPTQQRQVSMNYTNENRSKETFNTNCSLNINSKYGVLTVNRLSNYNASNDILEVIDKDIKTATLDMGADSKEATQEATIINNYETAIVETAVIGRLPDIVANEANKSAFELNLLTPINVNGKSARVYYSEDVTADKDSNTWKEEVEDFSKVKSFKIVPEESKLQPHEVLSISYKLGIPNNLGEDQSSYSSLELGYNYLGSSTTVNSDIILQTTQQAKKLVQKAEGVLEQGELSYNVVAKSAGKVLSEGEEIYEGQAVEYEVTLTNNSNNTYNNINIIGQNTNAIYYDEVKRPADMQPIDSPETIYVTYIEENTELTEKQINADSIKPGETKTFTYQISAKEVEGNEEVLTNTIKVTADNLEKKITGITLKIKQADLKLSIRNDYEEEIKILTESDLPVELGIRNISGTAMENVIVEFPIPKEVVFSTEGIYITEKDKYEFVEYSNNIVKFRIKQIDANEDIKINVGLTAGEMNYNTATMNTTMRFSATANNKKYTSNDIYRTIHQYKTEIIAKQTASVPDNSYLNDGDKVTFTFDIENKGMFDTELSIYDKIPEGLKIKEAYFVKDGKKQEINLEYQNNTEDSESQEPEEVEQTVITINNIDEEIQINKNEKVSLIIETYVNINAADTSKIENYAEMNAVEMDRITTNKITYYLNGVEDEDDEDDENSKYYISGTAWNDENKNGMMDETESKLSNIEVVLVDASTGEIVQDEDGEKCIKKTSEDGKYEFEEIQQGNYMVIFKYDATKYRITEYQKEGIDDTKNSDIISKEITLNGETIQAGITATLPLNKDLSNIDAGLIEGEKFDLKLEKYISRLIVQDSSGTKVLNYDGAQLVRTEIDAKRIANATVILEYNIKITNEGDIPGYTNDIVDYIPKDLRFVSEMNKNWYQGTDGYLHTKELADEIVNPGESKAITLTLVKNMTQDNAGTIINTAEIETASNSFSMKDIDSTPANKVSGEDDMSTAEAIISIRTGAVATIIGVMLFATVILGIGMYFIKKDVLENK